MFAAGAGASVGNIELRITNGRTKTAEEWADEVADKVIFIADTAAPAIRDQAQAFKDQIRHVVAANVAAAVREERAACAALAEREGATLAARVIRSR